MPELQPQFVIAVELRERMSDYANLFCGYNTLSISYL